MPPRSKAGSVGKIDAALNDGPEQLVEAVTNNLGIPIDHYVSINFDGFQHVVDSLGGIDMSFPTPMRDSYSGLHITKVGCTHLRGSAALSVVRARHLQYLGPDGLWVDDPQSDLGRIRRNHEFLTIFAKTMKARGLTEPLRANAVLGNLVHQVTIDRRFRVGTMAGLLRRYHNLNPDNVPQYTLPVTLVPQANYRYGAGTYGSVVFPSQPADAQVIATFLGSPPPHADPAPVAIVDMSGTGAGRKVAEGLAGAGFPVTGITQRAAPARPSETVVRYRPADLGAAQKLLASLSGAALTHADPQAPAGTLILEVGSVVGAGGYTVSRSHRLAHRAHARRPTHHRFDNPAPELRPPRLLTDAGGGPPLRRRCSAAACRGGRRSHSGQRVEKGETFWRAPPVGGDHIRPCPSRRAAQGPADHDHVVGQSDHRHEVGDEVYGLEVVGNRHPQPPPHRARQGAIRGQAPHQADHLRKHAGQGGDRLARGAADGYGQGEQQPDRRQGHAQADQHTEEQESLLLSAGRIDL